MDTERRAYPRAHLDCRTAVFSDLRIMAYNVDATNISAGGVRIELAEQALAASPVQLELCLLHEATVVQCTGEVVWFKEQPAAGKKARFFDTGIKFKDIDEGIRKKISDSVASFLAATVAS